MTLPDEPAGWHRLHAMAQSAPDAQSLARIVAEMNRILEEHQKAVELVTHLEEAGREAREKLYAQPQQPT